MTMISYPKIADLFSGSRDFLAFTDASKPRKEAITEFGHKIREVDRLPAGVLAIIVDDATQKILCIIRE